MKDFARKIRKQGTLLKRCYDLVFQKTGSERKKLEYQLGDCHLTIIFDLPIAVGYLCCFRSCKEESETVRSSRRFTEQQPTVSIKILSGSYLVFLARSKASPLKSITLVLYRHPDKRFSFAKLNYRASISNNQRQSKMGKCAACAENPEFLKRRRHNLAEMFTVLNFH